MGYIHIALGGYMIRSVAEDLLVTRLLRGRLIRTSWSDRCPKGAKAPGLPQDKAPVAQGIEQRIPKLAV